MKLASCIIKGIVGNNMVFLADNLMSKDSFDAVNDGVISFEHVQDRIAAALYFEDKLFLQVTSSLDHGAIHFQCICESKFLFLNSICILRYGIWIILFLVNENR